MSLRTKARTGPIGSSSDSDDRSESSADSSKLDDPRRTRQDSTTPHQHHQQSRPDTIYYENVVPYNSEAPIPFPRIEGTEDDDQSMYEDPSIPDTNYDFSTESQSILEEEEEASAPSLPRVSPLRIDTQIAGPAPSRMSSSGPGSRTHQRRAVLQAIIYENHAQRVREDLKSQARPRIYYQQQQQQPSATGVENGRWRLERRLKKPSPKSVRFSDPLEVVESYNGEGSSDGTAVSYEAGPIFSDDSGVFTINSATGARRYLSREHGGEPAGTFDGSSIDPIDRRDRHHILDGAMGWLGAWAPLRRAIYATYSVAKRIPCLPRCLVAKVFRLGLTFCKCGLQFTIVTFGGPTIIGLNLTGIALVWLRNIARFHRVELAEQLFKNVMFNGGFLRRQCLRLRLLVAHALSYMPCIKGVAVLLYYSECVLEWISRSAQQETQMGVDVRHSDAKTDWSGITSDERRGGNGDLMHSNLMRQALEPQSFEDAAVTELLRAMDSVGIATEEPGRFEDDEPMPKVLRMPPSVSLLSGDICFSNDLGAEKSPEGSALRPNLYEEAYVGREPSESSQAAARSSPSATPPQSPYTQELPRSRSYRPAMVVREGSGGTQASAGPSIFPANSPDTSEPLRLNRLISWNSMPALDQARQNIRDINASIGPSTAVNERPPTPLSNGLRSTFGSPLRTEQLSPQHHQVSTSVVRTLSGVQSVQSLSETFSRSDLRRESIASEPSQVDGAGQEGGDSDLSSENSCCSPFNCAPSSWSGKRNAGSTQSPIPLGPLPSGRNRAAQGPAQKYGKWSVKRLFSAARSSLDSFSDEMNPSPSPELDADARELLPPARHVPTTPPPAYKGVNIPMSERRRAKLNAALEHGRNRDQAPSSSSVSPLSLDGTAKAGDESPPPPMQSPKKRAKQVALPPTLEHRESSKSFGIDHSYSSPDSERNGGDKVEDDTNGNGESSTKGPQESDQPRNDSTTTSKDQEGPFVRDQLSKIIALSADVPREPDPMRYLGRNMSFMSQLFFPALPDCAHYLKDRPASGPPPDLLEAESRPVTLEKNRGRSITDFCEEAYIGTSRFYICRPGPGKYVSYQIAKAIAQTDIGKEGSAVTTARDWGMHCLAQKLTERFQRWHVAYDNARARGALEMESDDEDRTPRQSFSESSPTPKDQTKLDMEDDERDQKELAEYQRKLETIAGQKGECSRKHGVSMPPHPWESAGSSLDMPKLVRTSERRDSNANEDPFSSDPEPSTKSTSQPQLGAHYHEHEWTPPPPYGNAAAEAFPVTNDDMTVRMRDQADNASISTTSSQRSRLSFGLQSKAKQWKPLQSKSTAGVGISAGQTAVGSLSLREAVSPTRIRRSSSSATHRLSTMFEAPSVVHRGNPAPNEYDVHSASGVPLKGILKTTRIDVERDEEHEQQSWEHRRAQLNRELNFKPLTPRHACASNGDMNASYSKRKTSRGLVSADSAADRASGPAQRHDPVSSENASPSSPHARSHKSAASTTLPGPSELFLPARKGSWKHKRSNAVDMTNIKGQTARGS